MTNSLPRLAITMGDAAGVGPELALHAWSLPAVRAMCVPLLYGDAELLRRVAEELGLEFPDDARTCGELKAESVVPGTFSKQTGRASYETVCHAIDDALSGEVDGVVTGPIQKEAWSDAGIEFPGHTELIADRVGNASNVDAGDVRMMLTSELLSCILETIHIPLADVASALTVESLVHTIKLAGKTAQARNRSRGVLLPPKIAVCGLNPHAGENGLFSHGEERNVIEPAMELARKQGWDVAGPLPPDTAFTATMRERFDVHVCMYHDQGLIPLKALSFDDGVNVTLGLPIVRTSVDHGTAMDLAWKGTASCTSMVAAIRLAAELASGS